MENIFNKEWIQTNGLGGYASSTVEGANTRSYHGLLVAALNPPTDRTVFVAKIEERLKINDTYHDLSTNQYPGAVHPNGSQYLKCFQPAPYPKWQYECKTIILEKNTLVVQNENATLLNYINKGETNINLEIHPLYAFSNFHDLFHESELTAFYTEFNENHLKTYPDDQSPPIFTKWNNGEYIEKRSWYKNIILPMEAKRGLDYNCDYYRVGYLNCLLKPGEQVTLLFSLNEALLEEDNNALFISESKKLKKAYNNRECTFYKDLLRSGKQFLVERNSTDSQSIIAGYHWFSDWGRDTMIAMRGLTIATKNQKASKSILSTFLKNVSEGMLPNRFPDNSEDLVEYNTIDATLWTFVAIYDYYNTFKDLVFIKKQISVLKSILDWHIKGTRYNIKVTSEGFLYGGQEGVQLTWMDAITDGKVITPRIGCPVEINALWYNALKIYEYLSEAIGAHNPQNYKDIQIKLEQNFVDNFMNGTDALYDVIIPNGHKDSSFRSNQIYCLSLPFVLIDKPHQKNIFEAITKKLFTPYGLRTLEKSNPNFEGIYFGNQWQRDHSYHQGTIWPFLLGAYYDAFFSIYGTTKENKLKVIKELKVLKNHFYNEAGLHCISEIFDGENPNQGKGTIQQAWSVSALIKLYSDYRLYELDVD